MLLFRPPTSKKLTGIVEQFWAINDPEAEGHESLLPSGKAQMIFSLSNIPLATSAPDAAPLGTQAMQVLQGPMSVPRRVSRSSQVALCGVAFTAGGVGAILDHVEDISDRVLDLCGLWGPCAHDLRECLCNAKTDHSRLDLLEVEILRRLTNTTDVSLVQRAISLLKDGHTIKDTCAIMDCTPYIFRKLFLKTVGFTPKRYLRIARFRATAAELTPYSSLVEVAADRSYADQAHMTREVDRFGSMTPGRLKSIDRRYPGHVPDD